MAYVGLYLGIRSGDWQLRIACMKMMAPIFTARIAEKASELKELSHGLRERAPYHVIWRAGASQPSRRTDTIFLYIYIYLFLSGEATYRITLYVLLNQRGLRTSSISAPQLPENSGYHRKKPDFSAHSGNKPFSPNNAAHFSQCSLLYSWLQRVLQPLWKAWMGLSHQQLVVAVALRLVGGGWNVSVHAGGSALQQRRGRGVCLSVELGTEHDVPPDPRRPARHASCRWGLLSVEDERPIHMCI